MIIDINNLDEVENKNFKGGDGSYLCKSYFDGTNKIMKGRLKTGCSIGLHKHEGNCEIIYILEGTGVLLEDEEAEKVIIPGQVAYCPEGHTHSLINKSKGDLIFFAIVPKQ